MAKWLNNEKDESGNAQLNENLEKMSMIAHTIDGNTQAFANLQYERFQFGNFDFGFDEIQWDLNLFMDSKVDVI